MSTTVTAKKKKTTSSKKKRADAKANAAEARDMAHLKAEERVLAMARRWAKRMRKADVLSSQSHWLLRAVDKLEALEAADAVSDPFWKPGVRS